MASLLYVSKTSNYPFPIHFGYVSNDFIHVKVLQIFFLGTVHRLICQKITNLTFINISRNQWMMTSRGLLESGWSVEKIRPSPTITVFFPLVFSSFQNLYLPFNITHTVYCIICSIPLWGFAMVFLLINVYSKSS